MAYVEPGKIYSTLREGEVLVVSLDEDCPSPREDDEGNLGTFHIWSGSVDSPDGPPPADISELGAEIGIECDDHPKSFCAALNASGKGYGLPVWVACHSGITYRAAMENPFVPREDTHLAGLIYTTVETLSEKGLSRFPDVGVPRMLDAKLKHEVEVYDNWAAGRCFSCTSYDLATGAQGATYSGFIGDESEMNGMDSEYGDLEETSYSSVEEACEVWELANWDWRNDVLDAKDILSKTQYENVAWRMANVDRERYYSVEDKMDLIHRGHIWCVPKGSHLYECLADFHGGEKTLTDKVRLGVEVGNYLCSFTLDGYEIFNNDLFNPLGNDDGLLRFEAFCERWRNQTLAAAGFEEPAERPTARRR